MGAGKTVTVSGLTLTGAAAGNYTLATHDGDDDGGDHGGDGDAGGDGGEQDVRRDDERDADELHAEWRGGRRRGELHGHGGVCDGERGRRARR